MQVRLDLLILLIEQRHVDNQVADYRHAWQRAQNQLVHFAFGRFRNRSNTRQTILTIDVHTIRTTHTFTA